MADVLSRIPGLGGYLAMQDRQRSQALGDLQQVSGIARILQEQEQAQRQAQLAPLQMELMRAQVADAQRKTDSGAQLDAMISRLPPEQQALARLAPQQFVSSLFREDRPQVVAPGAAIVQGGMEVYRNPAADRDTRTQFEKLLDAGGVTDPQRRAQLIGQYISKQSTHQAPVNVYSSSLVPGVDAQGNPVFIQPSSRPDVPPRKVEGFAPAPKASSQKSNTDAMIGEYEAADQIIDKMIANIRAGGRFGTVGAPGMASQVYETVTGTVNPEAQTPAIDLRSQKEQLLDKMKALATRKDSSVSNKDVERYEQILGFDKVLTTPAATIRALNNVKEDLRRRRINLNLAPAKPAQVDKYEVGKVYQDASGSKAVYRGNGQWEQQ